MLTKDPFSKTEFTGSAAQLRVMYEHGWGITEIMARTAKPYIEVITRLQSAGTKLITGGPHDTTDCLHHHELETEHANGATCCVCTAKPRSRRELRIAGGKNA